MTPDEFFAKFEVFAEAANDVTKIRELVWELAIQGRIVPQDGDEEPAAKQLERIAAKKAKAGRVVRAKSLRAKREGSATSLPGGWAKATLADLVTVLNGRAYAKDELIAAGTPVLRVGNLFTSKHWYYSDLQLEPDKYCDKGDLIFAWSASFGPFIWTGPKVIYHYHIWKFDLHSVADVAKRYLYWFLQNKTQEIKRAGHGVSMLHMTKEKMEQLEVMVPPLAEQKRIVAKVDELMALCDRLEAQQKERETRHASLARASLSRFADAPTPANLTFLFHKSYTIPPADLRKAILTLAVEMRLVPEECNGEKAAVVSMERLVGRKNLKNGLSLVTTQAPTEFVCLPLSAMKGSTIDCNFGKPIALSAERAQPYLVKHGDIFIMRGNGSKERVGVAGMVRSWRPNVLFPDLFIHVPLPVDRIDPEYFVIAWNSPVTRSTLESLAKTTSGIWKINQGHISECEIPLPPLAEQRRIVAKVDQLMALVDELETQLATSRATAAKLLDAIVGELTS